MSATLDRIVIYAHDPEAMIAFYRDHFAYDPIRDAGDRIVELRPPSGGLTLLLHPAARGARRGQAQVKLVFSVVDLPAARDALIGGGVAVGPIHQADGYAFANLKDPGGNAVSISSRAFRNAAVQG